MRDLIGSILDWQKESKKIALATVVKVYGSAPRPLGSKMVINDLMDFTGSVSGGCVESNVIENALSVMKTGKSRLVQYGISDDTAIGFGLACGGEIEVFIEVFPNPEPKNDAAKDIYNNILQIYQESKLGAVVTILSGKHLGHKLLHFGSSFRSSSSAMLENSELLENAKNALENQKSIKESVSLENEQVDIFIDVISPQATLIIIGGVHIAIPLVQMANLMGFKTVVMDSRSAFATENRFPHADEVIVGWPAKKFEEYRINENTYVVFLSHDEKIDNPALQVALGSNARYIGALGSRKTHQARIESLIEMGMHRQILEKIHAPIGLNLGAVGAEQIALSIIAEIISIQNGVL